MSPHSPACGSVRSAAVVNEVIRALVLRARGREWTRAEQALYGLLRDEWVDALRNEVAEAA
ncbi:hypothetical protein [Streptomyces sp. NPDC088812]|uniref:hypothetical protein n=1 Tax=Streptomyces sp. NPDC088812 TaxID=3365905 RepID=UPI00382A8844